MGITTTQTKMKIWTRIHTHKEKKKTIIKDSKDYWFAAIKIAIEIGVRQIEKENQLGVIFACRLFFFVSRCTRIGENCLVFFSPLLQNVYLKNENFRERGGQPNASRAICPELFSFLFFSFSFERFKAFRLTMLRGQMAGFPCRVAFRIKHLQKEKNVMDKNVWSER